MNKDKKGEIIKATKKGKVTKNNIEIKKNKNIKKNKVNYSKKKNKKTMSKNAIMFIILIVVIALVSIMFLNKYFSDGKSVNASINENLTEVSIKDLIDVETIDSIEELQALNEKELEEALKQEEEDEKKKQEENNKNEDKKADEKKELIENVPKEMYYIKVNYGAQVVTIYKKDQDNKYTVPVKAMVCSTGNATPKSGIYKIPRRWNWGALFGGVYGQYVTQIVGNILFHSVPYLKRFDSASLEYWEYDKLGTKASAGCVRLTVADAKWIYDNCKTGTQVEFYSDSNPGPLGKPSARKISNEKPELRNWDPTDPSSDNPWKKYFEEQKKKEEDEKKNNVNVTNSTNIINTLNVINTTNVMNTANVVSNVVNTVNTINATNTANTLNVTNITNTTNVTNITNTTNMVNTTNVLNTTNVTNTMNIVNTTKPSNTLNITNMTNMMKPANTTNTTNVINKK